MVLAAEGRKAKDSHADCYQYFCVPEYGTANGRLHFHAVHFMRTLPTGSVDPNFGRRVRNRRQLNSLQNTWPYGYSMPIAVRYTQDAFSRSGWSWPVDAKGEPLKATSYMAVGFYVAKYVNKKSDMDLAAKGLGAKEDRKSGSAGMPRPTSYAVFCLKKKRHQKALIKMPLEHEAVIADIPTAPQTDCASIQWVSSPQNTKVRVYARNAMHDNHQNASST